MTRASSALIITALAAVCTSASGQPIAVPGGEVGGILGDPAPTGARRALVVCGLSGDADHHARFSKLVDQWQRVFTEKMGFKASDVIVLTGDEPAEKDSEVLRQSQRSTREELAAAAKTLCGQSDAGDAVWVVVLGHSHFDARMSWLNLPGPDVTQHDFAALFETLAAREQVFVIATPTSGQYIKPLSRAGRVIVTATESDWETNETEFPYELAALLESPPSLQEIDVDADGTISLLDVYLATARRVAQSYLDREFLSTEHSLLDDNGDGRGTELQIDYLTVEQGGRVRPGRSYRPPVASGTDGALSKSIQVPITPAPEAEAPAEATSEATPVTDAVTN